MSRELSPYEKARQERIARNMQVLRDLGLALVQFPAAPKPQARRKSEPRIPSEPERRSKRARTSTAAAAGAGGGGEEDDDDDEEEEVEGGGRSKRKQPPGERAPPAHSHSIRNLNVDLDLLDSTYLGEAIPPLGTEVKRAVMEIASSVHPKFSRMSGIQEWKNCIYLFVNVGGKEYVNTFRTEKKRCWVTWFAQKRQDESSPVIVKMLTKECPVVLFCRPVDCNYYVYCGRLSLVSSNLKSSPLSFEWELADFSKVCDSSKFLPLIIDL